jgi:hypothetical protein
MAGSLSAGTKNHKVLGQSMNFNAAEMNCVGFSNCTDFVAEPEHIPTSSGNVVGITRRGKKK